MNEKILALAVLAKDEASATLAKIEGAIGQLERRANLAHHAMGALHDVLRGIAMGLGINAWNDLAAIIGRVVDFFPNLIDKGRAFADAVHRIMAETGGSAQSVSQLVGQFQFMGISVDGIAQKLAIFSRNVIAHASDLKALGISILDANGHTADQITLFQRVQTALSGMQDGTRKTREEQMLFGRSMADLIPLLGLSKEQLALLNQQLKESGVIMDEDAVKKAREAEVAYKNLNLSLQGLGNTLASDLGPIIAQTVDSIAKWINQNSANIAAFAENVINTVIGVIDGLFGLNVAAVNFSHAFVDAAGAAQTFSPALDTLGDKTTKGTGTTKANTEAQREAIRAIDDKVRAITAEEKALDKAQAAENKAAAAATRARNDMVAGIDRQLNAQLKLLDAQDKERSEAESMAGLAQQLEDAQRKLAQDQAGGNPDQVHSDLEQINNIKQQMSDIAYRDAQDKARQDLQDKAQAAKDEIAKAQAVADQHLAAQQKVHDDKKAKLEASKNLLEDEKRKVQDTMAAIRAAAAGATTGAGGLGPSFKTATDMASQGVGALAMAVGAGVGGITGSGEAHGGGGSLTDAMEAARKSGVQMGKDIKAALDSVTGAAGKAVDIIGGIAHAIAGIDKPALGLGALALGVALGNPLIALAGATLLGISIANAGPTADPTGNAGPGRGSRVPPGGTRIGGPNTFPGNASPHAMGGWVGLNGPELGLLGEQGPEYIVSNDKLGRSSQSAVIHSHVYLDGRQIAESVERILFNNSRIYNPAAPGEGF